METKKKHLSILFIGNSFSYYHALPKLLALFVKRSGIADLAVDGVFRGGATLKMLWDDGAAVEKIRSREWDYVVLQERGRLGGILKNGVVHVGKPQDFFTYTGKFYKEIKKNGSKMILYCPPAFLGRGAVGDAQKMQRIYRTLASEWKAMVIPSIDAFALAQKEKPSLNLYERDGHHPNPLGTYLVASLFYKKLFRKTIKDFPLKSYKSHSRELPRRPVRVGISKSDAFFLWSVSDRVK